MITYEYPFNERIRTLLRLEDLFYKTNGFLQRDGSQEHHVVLLTLFEILDVAGRADLKMDLIQELERQRQSLLSYRNNPDISEDALSGALYEIEQASAALLGMTGKIGQHLRDNDWLMSIKSRASIPGGVCEFDLPSYHYWRHQDPGEVGQPLRGAGRLPLVGQREEGPEVERETSDRGFGDVTRLVRHLPQSTSLVHPFTKSRPCSQDPSEQVGRVGIPPS